MPQNVPVRKPKHDKNNNKFLTADERKGLVHKCNTLEKGMRFYKAECDVLNFKYNSAKDKIKAQKKARESDIKAYNRHIQMLTSQMQQMAIMTPTSILTFDNSDSDHSDGSVKIPTYLKITMEKPRVE